jgi:hypothetical protein
MDEAQNQIFPVYAAFKSNDPEFKSRNAKLTKLKKLEAKPITTLVMMVERYRRALYMHFWRATPHPALAVFDAPDGFSTVHAAAPVEHAVASPEAFE